MDNDIRKFLVAKINEQFIGIDFKHVKETALLTQNLNINYLHSNIRGLINIKGKIIPVLDPFFLSRDMDHDYDLLIIISYRPYIFSFLCEEVTDIIMISSSSLLQLNDIEYDFINTYFPYNDICVHVFDIKRYLKYLNKSLSSTGQGSKEGK